MSWVSVEDSWPTESDECYLVYTTDDDMYVATWYAKYPEGHPANFVVEVAFGSGFYNVFACNGANMPFKITHWMPLPAVPEQTVESAE